MVGDTGDAISQPSLRVDAVEIGGLDKAVGAGGPVTALVRAREQPDGMTIAGWRARRLA